MNVFERAERHYGRKLPEDRRLLVLILATKTRGSRLSDWFYRFYDPTWEDDDALVTKDEHDAMPWWRRRCATLGMWTDQVNSAVAYRKAARRGPTA